MQTCQCVDVSFLDLLCYLDHSISYCLDFISCKRRCFVLKTQTVLPKYFAPTRSFAQLALPVDRELDVRSCSPAAIAQHRASPCEDCRNFFRQRDTSSVSKELCSVMECYSSLMYTILVARLNMILDLLRL